MPLGVESFRLFAPAEGKLWSVATVDVPAEAHRETIKAQIQVADEHGRLIAELRGMSFKRADRATLERAIQRSIDQWLYEIAWEPLDEEAPTGVSAPLPEFEGLVESLHNDLRSIHQSIGTRSVRTVAAAPGSCLQCLHCSRVE